MEVDESQPQQDGSELAKIKAEEETAEDPDAVDEVLVRSMMSLSVRDRNQIQEEIHGVRCLAVEETPELIARALAELNTEIEERTIDSEKRAYLRSQEPPRRGDAVVPGQPPMGAAGSAVLPPEETKPPYTSDDEFRLRFLRCELFDVRKSAKRMLSFLDLALELFGDYALRRPIRLSDFSKEEIRYMRNGRFQIMLSRDRSGRRVSTIFPEQKDLKCPPKVKVRERKPRVGM